MEKDRSKEAQSDFRRKGGWLGFVAACLLAFAMACGVATAIYGNFDYTLIAGFNQQTKQKVWKIEAKYSNVLIEDKTENLIR